MVVMRVVTMLRISQAGHIPFVDATVDYTQNMSPTLIQIIICNVWLPMFVINC